MQPLTVTRVEASLKEDVAQWERQQQKKERTAVFEAEDEGRGGEGRRVKICCRI